MVKTKTFFLVGALLILMVSFKYISKKSVAKKPSTTSFLQENKIDELISIALDFEGTPYTYGGTTKKGMDCSGLVYTCFNKIGKQLPRSSYKQSFKGIEIPLVDVKKGDLLFFKTDSSEKINHVGLVINTQNNKLEFIHSSTSKGIIVSTLQELYWKENFVIAKRMF